MTGVGRRFGSDLLATLPAWVVARLLVGVSWVVTHLVSGQLFDDPDRPSRAGRGLMAWDADWYQSLVLHGYDAVPLEGVRFFPGFVLLGRLVDSLLPGGPALALVAVANLGSLLAGVALYRLVLTETANHRLAERSVWLLACFPSSFVLVWGYAEGPFLAASIAMFLALRRQNWWGAAALGVTAALLRPTGVLLVLPALMVAGRNWRECDVGEKLQRFATIAAAPAGCGAFVLWASLHFDEPFAPFTVQEKLRGETVNPVSRLIDGFGDLFGAETLGDGLHIPFVLAFLALTVVLFLRWPAHYGMYAFTVLFVALCSENLNSLERYGLNGFPIIVGLAVLAGHRRFGPAAPILGSAGLVSLSVLAWVGIYVP